LESNQVQIQVGEGEGVGAAAEGVEHGELMASSWGKSSRDSEREAGSEQQQMRLEKKSFRSPRSSSLVPESVRPSKSSM
jgi:hypothetical protein